MRAHTWADCPIVFFAAPAWRLELLAELIVAEGCGLDQDRRMLTVYGPSIRRTHGLAERILSERGRFRRRPPIHRSRPRTATPKQAQMDVFSDVPD